VRCFFSGKFQKVVILPNRDLQDARKKLNDMENKRKNSGEEAEKLRNALQEAVDKAKNANKEVSVDA
jgi:predicted  nucleic acid-binding Zn-ribbon protein